MVSCRSVIRCTNQRNNTLEQCYCHHITSISEAHTTKLRIMKLMHYRFPHAENRNGYPAHAKIREFFHELLLERISLQEQLLLQEKWQSLQPQLWGIFHYMVIRSFKSRYLTLTRDKFGCLITIRQCTFSVLISFQQLASQFFLHLLWVDQINFYNLEAPWVIQDHHHYPPQHHHLTYTLQYSMHHNQMRVFNIECLFPISRIASLFSHKLISDTYIMSQVITVIMICLIG